MHRPFRRLKSQRIVIRLVAWSLPRLTDAEKGDACDEGEGAVGHLVISVAQEPHHGKPGGGGENISLACAAGDLKPQ